MFRAKIKTDSGKTHMDQLKKVVDDFNKQWEVASREMSKIDKAISDMHHFIEISPNLNAAEGYKIYKDLKELLELRRIVKDSLLEMRPFRKMVKNSNLNPMRLKRLSDEIQDQIDFNESEKYYKTRVLKSEFGDIIK